MSYLVRQSTLDGRGGPIAVRDYVSQTLSQTSALLWVHGGGFSSGGLDQKESDAPARHLAALGHRVRTIDYRLAPRFTVRGKMDLAPHPNRYPAAHHDVLDVATDLRAAHGGPISIGGASAGANLAMGATLALRDAGQELPVTLVLAYGTFHAVLPERADVEKDLRGLFAKWAFNPAMTTRMNVNYVGDEALLRPGYAFPGRANLHGLPPTLILNARNDRLRKSGDTFADELRAAGVDVGYDVVESSHGFLNAPRKHAYARGMRVVEEWLRRHG
jgi:acetyl esterase